MANFFNLNTGCIIQLCIFWDSMYVRKKIISKFCWHCISVWSLGRLASLIIRLSRRVYESSFGNLEDNLNTAEKGKNM